MAESSTGKENTEVLKITELSKVPSLFNEVGSVWWLTLSTRQALGSPGKRISVGDLVGFWADFGGLS